MLAAEGKRRIREISTAVSFSGLMSRSMPMPIFSIPWAAVYSKLRTRAMVYLAPRRLPVRQQTIFTSSRLVTAMSRSAVSAPASFRAVREAPLPLMHMTSSVSEAFCSALSLVSMMVTSCSSRERCSAKVKPTLPSPTMMIFKTPHPLCVI